MEYEGDIYSSGAPKSNGSHVCTIPFRDSACPTWLHGVLENPNEFNEVDSILPWFLLKTSILYITYIYIYTYIDI